MALTRQIRRFLTNLCWFVTNDDANAEMPELQDIFLKLYVENREMSKIGTIFDVVSLWFFGLTIVFTVNIIIIHQNRHMS